MSKTCRLFGISRQAIYQQEARCLEREEEFLTIKQLIEKQRRIMPRLGTRKLYFLLKQSFVENGGQFRRVFAHREPEWKLMVGDAG